MADPDYAVEPETKVRKVSARKKHHVSYYYLPQELVSNILLLISAQGLHDVVRHVCREWSLIIRSQDFIYSHLRNSTGGFLVQQTHPTRSVVYVEMQGAERVEISEFYWGFEGQIINSCNGLVLTAGPRGDFYHPFVINPLTKQRVTLPPCDGHETEIRAYFAIAFVEASMEYKVVCSRDIKESGRRVTKLSVLTIGVDRYWRKICVEHLTPGRREWKTLLSFPLVTGGYMHWIGSTFLLMLNVETETFYQFLLPRPLTPRRRCTHFLPMGNKLSAADQSRKYSTYIWEMNPENGEWTMLHCIDFMRLRPMFYGFFRKKERPLTPFGWLVAREVLVFEALNRNPHGCSCMAYKVKTQEFMSFELASNRLHCSIHSHVKSLVCFE